jgi:hypothetical protein
MPKRKPPDEDALLGLRREAKRIARELQPAAGKAALAAELQRAIGPQICLGRELADGVPLMRPPEKLPDDANGLAAAVREKEVFRAVNGIYQQVLAPQNMSSAN